MSTKEVDNDILHEIPDKDLPALKEMFKKDWPYAMHAFYRLDNYIDWKNRGLTNIVILCPDGRWDDGTFITIEDHGSTFDIFIFTLEKSCHRLQVSLEKSSKIKWNEKDVYSCFLAVHEDHLPTVINEINRRGIKISHQDNGNLWWMSREEAAKFKYDIPNEVYLAPLKPEDVDIIDPVWPHRGAFSKEYLKKLIVTNGGFGLYLKTDDSLCSWIMRNNYGGLAILQTIEEHKRKGYGSVLTKHFSKYWAEKGLDIFCFIMKENKASLNLFKQFGFKKEHGITWTHVPNEI